MTGLATERRSVMRKRLKKKKRSYPMCKPHKMRGENRWKAKDKDALERAEKEIAAGETGIPKSISLIDR
jgi:hypothetical protein